LSWRRVLGWVERVVAVLIIATLAGLFVEAVVSALGPVELFP
jgi:hypothetical protein